MRNNKLINFILEFSQIMLVFFGVFSALMCAAYGLELEFNRGLCFLVLLLVSVLFYGLFTVLETFPKGKLYGILGITVFYGVLMFRFMGAVKKGVVTIANSFLKAFMNYTGSNLSLLAYKDNESAGVVFCTTLVMILLSAYFIAIISAFFYRKRRSYVFIILTLPLVLLPLAVGRVGYFSNMLTYLIMFVAVIGTRHLRTDATDRRLRQKLSFILVATGLVAGVISYAFMPPERYERNESKLVQAKNTMTALTNWSADDIFTWIKAYFNDDAIDYGRIGKKNKVTYSGETLLKISGDVNEKHSLYLKGYVGDIYQNNRWTGLSGDSEYEQDLQTIEDSAVTLENWHVQLRNELGDSETSGVDGLWKTATLRIRNLAFGYGNYLVPYLPADGFRYSSNGRITVANPGVDYTVEYYPVYPVVLRRDVISGDFSLANHVFWEGNAVERQKLTEFAEKYYMQVPESLQSICDDFSNYLKENKLETDSEIISAVKQYITKDTEYTLSPGKTPSGKDSIEYFLTENKKGYCVYYASAATILLRSAGIPARYVEGMYVSKEELEKGCEAGSEIDVLDKNAHAWVEVYQDKYGFVPLEVTPGFGESEGSSSENSSNENSSNADSSDTDSSDDKTEQDDTQTKEEPEKITPTPVVSGEPSSDNEEEDMIFDDIERDDEGNAADTSAADGSSRKILWKILEIAGIVILVLAAIEGQRRIRRYLFKRNVRRLRIKKRIRMAHRHLAVLFAQKGVVFRRQSMAEYTRELSQAMEMPYDKMYEYVGFVYRARFGPDDITEEDIAVFHIIYENIRRKAYENAKFLKKLYYMYIMVL